MRHKIWTPALIAGVLAAAAASPAAGECLSAPNGPAAKGQHWYYHLDRTTRQKCWYLRGAAPAAPAASEAAAGSQPNDAAPPAAEAAPAAASRTRAPTPPPAITQSGTSSPAATASAIPAAPAAVDDTPAAPQSTGSIWSDSPPASASGAQDAEAAPPAGASAASPAPEPPLALVQKAAPQIQPPNPAATKPKTPPGGSPAENLLIVAFAAVLAAVTFAAFMLARARKVAEAPLVPAASSGPRFGSGGVRRSSTRRSAGTPDETPPLPPIEVSLIPEQVPMPLPPLDTRR